MANTKKLKEGKLYEVKYNGYWKLEVTFIGYLIKIDLYGDLYFNDDKEAYRKSISSKKVSQEAIINIKELKEKGDAIKLKAE